MVRMSGWLASLSFAFCHHSCSADKWSRYCRKPRRAIEVLRDEDLVVTVQGRGTYVK
jgi:hypothetical protein